VALSSRRLGAFAQRPVRRHFERPEVKGCLQRPFRGALPSGVFSPSQGAFSRCFLEGPFEETGQELEGTAENGPLRDLFEGRLEENEAVSTSPRRTAEKRPPPGPPRPSRVGPKTVTTYWGRLYCEPAPQSPGRREGPDVVFPDEAEGLFPSSGPPPRGPFRKAPKRPVERGLREETVSNPSSKSPSKGVCIRFGIRPRRSRSSGSCPRNQALPGRRRMEIAAGPPLSRRR